MNNDIVPYVGSIVPYVGSIVPYVGRVVGLYPNSKFMVRNSGGINEENILYVDNSGIVHRWMFFSPQDGQSYDLLYETPNIPVLGLASIEECRNSNRVVDMACNLSDLFSFLGLEVPTTPEDAWKIGRTIFRYGFADDNREIFGLEPLQPTIVYSNNMCLFNGGAIPFENVEAFWNRYYEVKGDRMVGKDPLDTSIYEVLTDCSSLVPMALFWPKRAEKSEYGHVKRRTRF